MQHILEINDSSKTDLEDLFFKIREGSAILFLGAGASVTNKKYLSHELIELYQAKINQDLETDDIIEFVDILQSQEGFSRNEFDNFVEQQLRRLNPSPSHYHIAKIPWNQIITTNYDVLVERAFEKVRDSNEQELELKVIRSKDESYYTSDGSQLKYIKLNGCISDKSKYPLVFSTQDFQDSNGYYKEILNRLKGLSDRIVFISIGYSFRDKLADHIFKKFDKHNYRQRRMLYNIDPFANRSRLDYYSDQNIKVLGFSMEEFFRMYSEWDEKEGRSIVKSKKIAFTDHNENHFSIPTKLALKLDGCLSQLSKDSKIPYVRDVDYYLGEEPNYDVVRKGYDVKRTDEIKKIVRKIRSVALKKELLIPIVFSKGRFGTGKSTIAYQVINNLLKEDDFKCVAFEINDYLKLKAANLVELVDLSRSDYAIFYFNASEIDSHFRIITELRYELSSHQIDSCKIIFYVSIRENILEKHKKSRHLAESIEVKHTAKFNRVELDELIDKLKSKGLVELRDKKTKTQLIDSVQRNFGGDSFLTLTNLLSKGSHRNYLIDAYDQLQAKTKTAFIYTSLVYRFKIPMPGSILLGLVSSDWDTFRTDVIEVDGKGLLYHEINASRNVDHDIIFKTKHPALSELLIKELLTRKDEEYKLYHRLVSSIPDTHSNAGFCIDVLKSIRKNGILESSQINKLSDLGHSKFTDEPYYLLYYAMNLQRRRSLSYLKKAIEILHRAEGILEKRNHRFIHRRAVINFDIAKNYFNKEKTELDTTLMYLDEAEELFRLKQIFDPFSSFSYVDFVGFKMWCLRKIKYDLEDELRIKVQVQELLDFAIRAVRDNRGKVLSIRSEYLSEFSFEKEDYKKYEEQLWNYYEEGTDSRPFVLVLLAQLYIEKSFDEKLGNVIEELEAYDYLEDVVRFLFKYYGRRLYDSEVRTKYFELLQGNTFLEKEEPLRYHYYSYVAESYSSNFSRSYRHLEKIKFGFGFINPDYNEPWSDEAGFALLYKAKIIRSKGKLVARVEYFPKNFYLDIKCSGNASQGDEVEVQLNFYLFGIRAEIVKE